MRRFLALGLALVALITAGFVWTRDRPVAVAQEAPLPPVVPVPPDVVAAVGAAEPLVAPTSSVTPADREARRFARYDRDRDAVVSRDEYLAARRKAFARLDRDGDGRLGFEEFATATARKFARADRDANGRLAAAEFAATAVKRRARAAVTEAAPCGPEA